MLVELLDRHFEKIMEVMLWLMLFCLLGAVLFGLAGLVQAVKSPDEDQSVECSTQNEAQTLKR